MKTDKEIITTETSQKVGAVLTISAFLLMVIAFTLPDLNVHIYLGVFALMIVIIGMIAGPVMFLHKRVPRKIYIPGTIICWIFVIIAYLMAYVMAVQEIFSMIFISVSAIVGWLAWIFSCIWALDKLSKKSARTDSGSQIIGK